MMRILVIEDEYVALTKMVDMMSEYGPSDAATNGSQALELFRVAMLQGQPYDLITIDIELPDMNGIQLLHELNEREASTGKRAVKFIVSVASTTRNILQAAANHCDAFIVKPVKRAVLAEKMEQCGFKPAPTPAES